MSGDHPNYSIIDIGQNTDKTPGDFLSLSNASEKPSANAGIKNFQKSKIIIMMIIKNRHKNLNLARELKKTQK